MWRQIAAIQPAQSLLRTDFDENRGRLAGQLANQIGIAHRRGQMGHQIRADLCGIAHRFVRGDAVGRHQRSTECLAAEVLAEQFGGVTHQRRVEGAGDTQHARLEQLVLQHPLQFRQRRKRSAHHGLIGRVVVGHVHRSADLRSHLLDRFRRGGGGQHATLASRSLNRLAAVARHSHRLFQVPGSSGKQRRVLTVAVSGYHVRHNAAIAQSGQH